MIFYLKLELLVGMICFVGVINKILVSICRKIRDRKRN